MKAANRVFCRYWRYLLKSTALDFCQDHEPGLTIYIFFTAIFSFNSIQWCLGLGKDKVVPHTRAVKHAFDISMSVGSHHGVRSYQTNISCCFWCCSVHSWRTVSAFTLCSFFFLIASQCTSQVCLKSEGFPSSETTQIPECGARRESEGVFLSRVHLWWGMMAGGKR